MNVYIRSFVFDILFYILTPVYLFFFLPWIWIMPRSFTQRLFRIWVRGIVWGLKSIVGIEHRVEGLEHIKAAQAMGKPVLVASRHESAWDTFIFALYLGEFSIVLKKNLLFIPIFGLYLIRLGSIAINRKKVGAQAIRYVRDQAAQATQQHRMLLIFPEGTRCSPGQSKPLQPGVGLLYAQLGACIVPVAHNAGLCWGRRSLCKRPGVITLRFMPVILPGRNRKDAIEEVRSRIMLVEQN